MSTQTKTPLALAYQCIDKLLDREGGRYTNDPADAGGPTKWGWTQRGLSAHLRRPVTIDEIAGLTREDASNHYLQAHWFMPGFDKVAVLSVHIAAELLDTHVNLPPAKAVEFLQLALNALNGRGRLWPDVAVDADCGPATRNALDAYLKARGADAVPVLLEVMNAQLAVYYMSRTQAREANEDFFFGWVRERVLKAAI